MPGEAWFKPKSVGYGASPSHWKGWVATIGYGILVNALVLAATYERIAPIWVVIAVTAILVIFVKPKTSGPWRWRSRPDA